MRSIRVRCVTGDQSFQFFLAIDVGVPLDEMDATTQSIAFARASNAIIFIASLVSNNLGVGIEIGSVLEDFLSATEIQGSAADMIPPDQG